MPCHFPGGPAENGGVPEQSAAAGQWQGLQQLLSTIGAAAEPAGRGGGSACGGARVRCPAGPEGAGPLADGGAAHPGHRRRREAGGFSGGAEEPDGGRLQRAAERLRGDGHGRTAGAAHHSGALGGEGADLPRAKVRRAAALAAQPVSPERPFVNFWSFVPVVSQAKASTLHPGGHSQRGSAHSSQAAQHLVSARLPHASSGLGDGPRGDPGKNTICGFSRALFLFKSFGSLTQFCIQLLVGSTIMKSA